MEGSGDEEGRDQERRMSKGLEMTATCSRNAKQLPLQDRWLVVEAGAKD